MNSEIKVEVLIRTLQHIMVRDPVMRKPAIKTHINDAIDEQDNLSDEEKKELRDELMDTVDEFINSK